jgi:inner membrane protein
MKSTGTLARTARTHSVIVRLVVIGILLLALLLPLLAVQGLVREREQRRSETESEIIRSWGGEQTVAGPILTVPYVAHTLDANGKRVETVEAAHFLPDSLLIEGKVNPETRRRGMYEVTLYATTLAISGSFHAPDFSGWRVEPDSILWDEAVLSVEIPDMRALQERVSLTWNGDKREFRPGRGSVGMFAGEIRVALPGIRAARAERVPEIPFSFDLVLRGGGSLGFLPLGDQTIVRISSSWKSPNFSGAYLPATRSLTDHGFDAEWKVISMARAYPQRWMGGEIEPQTVRSSEFGLSLMTPVDTYLKVTRALKYGLLFLFLPFFTLFLFEVFSTRRIHPLQYLFVGFADCIFYFLLLSLSEHIAFGLAYGIASVCSTGLITAYTAAIVRSGRKGVVMLPVLGAAYGFLAVVLNSEDYALLFGSIGLFLILAFVMLLTRRVDWYRPGFRKTGSEVINQAEAPKAE